ncbi:uncharacterized protein GGS22DRAFT_172467 [Annulohypoxylon maeteangense]|uniref:uncharacterized protein n=1 Tax=Annulohypoxylon maeteangense TaxID=1927788 RepID=UPI00200838A7|nr:uncharacterized protein GGS22DRAFT_172467 [Annulohypoxylon maeteangense]KAI0881559.1 hypothetical protein GGS22DRAFT_172467 [Annulohypoxylon maeteangense]
MVRRNICMYLFVYELLALLGLFPNDPNTVFYLPYAVYNNWGHCIAPLYAPCISLYFQNAARYIDYISIV